MGLRGELLAHLESSKGNAQYLRRIRDTTLGLLEQSGNCRVYPAVRALPLDWESDKGWDWEGEPYLLEGQREKWIDALKGWIEHGI